MSVPTVCISCSADLAERGVLPAWVHPQDSVVVVVLRHDREALTARVDAVRALDRLAYLPQTLARTEGSEVPVVRYGAPSVAVLEPFAGALAAARDSVERLAA